MDIIHSPVDHHSTHVMYWKPQFQVFHDHAAGFDARYSCSSWGLYIQQLYRGFLSHGSTPIYHVCFFSMKKIIQLLEYPHDYGTPYNFSIHIRVLYPHLQFLWRRHFSP